MGEVKQKVRKQNKLEAYTVRWRRQGIICKIRYLRERGERQRDIVRQTETNIVDSVGV